jgi:hypothetical protein
MNRLVRVVLGALSLALLGAACDRPMPAAPIAPAAPAHRDLLSAITGLQLLSCPSGTTQSASAVIGPDGGTLAVGRFRVDFPAGAVPSPETFVLTVPASQHLDIEVHADGYEHYTFATPVDVTLDLSRCGLLPPGLQVWNVDLATSALLEPMGGTLDLLSRTMRFRAPHFSGYSIAW